MKKIINKVVYVLTIILILLGLFIDIYPYIILSNTGKIIFYILPMLLIVINMLVQIRISKSDEEKVKIRKHAFSTLFIIYIIILTTFLFFSTSYRVGNLFSWTSNYSLFSKENLSINLNIIPFKNIFEYINRLINNQINTSIVITNILGNLIAFAPFGFFIPELFKNKLKNTKQFTILMIITILTVEIVQFITRVGSFDIDDLILNLLGAFIVYKICNLEKFQRFLNKILLKTKEEG